MPKMLALVYEKPGDGKIVELPVPECGPDEVTIQVMSAAICKGADRRHHTVGHRLAKYPVTTGHEFAGFVYEVGKDVTCVRPGDRVTADNAVPCGHCHYCRIGMFVHCDNFGSLGHNIPGGFAQYLKVNQRAVFKIPEQLSFNEACLAEPVACCIHAMDRLAVRYGEDVLVFGAGPNGIIVSQLLKHSNANQVVTLASTQAKLDLLAEYGITTVLVNRDDPSAHQRVLNDMFPRGVAAVVDATGSPPVLENSIQFLRKRGRLLQYSTSPDDATISLSPSHFFKYELQYYTSYCQVYNFGRAVAVLADGKVKVDKLVTAEYPLEDFFKAIEDVTDRKVLKLIIHPNG
ncbi:MAG: alcohol dehydrogenase catalytic domain-containing protein [Planctomycetes bacterium]|nr:alcohol dehydrogenase catalytic domain-containing protein [Planctomycetota bacterium]